MPGQGDAGVQLAGMDAANAPTQTVETQLAEEVVARTDPGE